MTETSGPRGRISLIKAVGEGRLDLLSPGFVEQMWQCLDCRACEAVCPSGVRYGQLVETARAQIQRRRTADQSLREHPARRFLLRTLFARRDLMQVAASLLRFAQRSKLIALGRLFGFGAATTLAPTISADFFLPEDQRFEAAQPQGAAFLHVGCIMPFAFARTHRATVRMLQRGGLTVMVPRHQGCCGAVAVHAGDMDFARELATRNIEGFERSGADVYVVNAAGCGSALKEYHELLAGDSAWAGRATAFSKRVRDVTEVLDAVDLGTPGRTLDEDVAYQDACHLVHAQRISAAPRRLLGRIPGLNFVALEESAVCCGSAGIYNLTQPAMSSRLLHRKIGAIQRSGASVVATANPGCAIQIEAGLREAGCRVAVKHVVELLDGAYS